VRVEETIAAARGTGCRIVQVRQDAGEPRVELACSSGWAAARYLLELARRDARDPVIVRLAKRARELAPDDLGFARALYFFVQKAIRFEREKGEVFQSGPVTLRRGAGDCDCHARLMLALLLAGGMRARLAFLHRGEGPIHVLAQVHLSGGWVWLETTVKGAHFGEHPVAAARRLGVIRRDVGGNMREAFMGPVGVEGGNVYRMRIGVRAPRDEASETAVREVLGGLGFVDETIWLERAELPADFAPHAREDLEADGVVWTAWAEALYAQPMCRMIDMPIEIPANAREGLVAIVLDDVHVVPSSSSTRPPIKVAIVTAMSGLKIRELPSEQAKVLDLVHHLNRVVVLEEDLPATPAAPKGWTKVRAGAIEGFVSSEWLADAPPSSGATLGELGDAVVRYTADLSPAFFAKLKAVARRLNLDPEHAMSVMLSESGLRASAIHPSAPASGIFGLMFKTRAEAEAFKNQPAEMQLDAYERFMRPYAGLHLTTPEAIYQVNFLPASAIPSSGHFRGTHPGAVLAASDGTGYGGQEAGFYRDNVVLDVDRDGKITSGDLRATIERNKRANANRWNEAAARLAAAPEPEGLGDITLAVIPWLALVGFVWYMFRS
jgi:hypothetical protein